MMELENRIMLAAEVGAACDVSAAADATVADAVPVVAGGVHDRISKHTAADLVFISPDVPDLEGIVAGISSEASYVLLNPTRPGLEQITQTLRSHANVRSIHIIAHGDSGQVVLGNQSVTAETLVRYQDQLRSWSQTLTADADILLYGCDVASGVKGEQFVHLLSRLTSTDVAASVDMTGSPLLGGDWDLEYSVGLIESGLAINEPARRNFGGLLPITIEAAGVTGEEQMLLQIDGVTVATFDDVGGDAYGGVFESYTHNADGVSADDVRVVFTNDLFDPITFDDRNLRVDKIIIDGVTYETEHPSVFSTGTWLPEDGITPGFRQSEFLHANGYFQYAELAPNAGSLIEIRANGTEGPELMELRIDGTSVASWSSIGTTPQTFSYTAADTVTPSQVQVAFTNDLWDPDAGIDRNLVVDWISIDGETFQTEHPSVYSTGSWLPGDGIAPGFRLSETLNANGYFQYDEITPNNGSEIVIYARGSEGDESMSLQIDGTAVNVWNSIGTTQQGFSYTAAGTVTADQIRVAFTNDLWDPDAGIDRNLIVDRITVDGVNFETEDPSVYSTGSWLPGDGITPGFRESEVLNANGYFQYATPAVEPGELSFADTTVTVDESAVSVTLTVNRSGGSDGVITVAYATSDGTAVADEDYVADSGTITFADGQISQTIVIDLLGDNDDEADEQFLVTLSSPTGGAALVDGVATAFVVDDDQATLNGSPLFTYQGHLYLATSSATSWTAAQAEAESLGGNLVTVNDVAEEDWLKQTFGSQTFWIGLQENPVSGEFEWVSGEPVEYTHWASGKPDDPFTQNYAVMNWQTTGQWSDQRDTLQTLGIIEIGTSIADGIDGVPNGTGFSTEVIASGLNQPIAFDEAPDGRIFVTEKAGLIRVIDQNGQLLPTPFLDINLEVNSHHDRGLMGIALDPDFATNGYVYYQYAVELDPANPDAPDFNSPAGGRLERIAASTADPNVADLTTRIVIQDGHQMTHAAHTVGDIDFDNDGNLIFTWGDGGFDPAVRLSVQDENSAQGKLFRIDRTTFEGVSTNPYYDAQDPSSIASRVWAKGIRNSWKFTVDTLTGDIYMGEVTDTGPEEVNIMRGDASTFPNFGWPYYQGDSETDYYGPVPPGFQYESAFVQLPHTGLGGGDSIVGGAVFRGDTVYPDVYDGRYFFGNFNQGILYTADASGAVPTVWGRRRLCRGG